MQKEFSLKLLVEAVDKLTSPIGKMGKALGNFAKKSGLDNVGRAGKRLGKSLGQSLKEIGKVGGVVAALGVSMFGLVGSSAAVGDEIAKTASKLGVGVVALQRMEHHAGLSGVATSQFRDSLRFLLNAAGEAADGVGTAKDTFVKLGISVKDGSGKIKDAETLMGEIADAMSRVTDENRRVTIAQDLFGRSGANMINMLKDGSSAMRSAGDEAEALGVITEEQARAAESFNDNMARLQRVVTQVGHALANELLPHFDGFLVQLKDLALEAKPGIIAWFKNAVTELGEVLPGLMSATWSVVKAVGSFVAWVNDAIDATIGWEAAAVLLLAVMGGKLIISLASTAVGFVSLAAAVAGAIPKVIALGAALLANPVGLMIAGIAAAIVAVAAAAYLVYRHWDEIVAFLKETWNEIEGAFDEGLIQGLVKVLETFNPVVIIAKAVNELVDYFFGIDLSEVGKAWIGSFIDGVVAIWTEFTDWFTSKLDVLSGVGQSLARAVGIDVGNLNLGGLGEPVPSAITNRNSFSGEMKITLDNLPKGTRVETKKDSGIDVNVDAGFAMGGN